jgi:peptidoglycan hydrolase-like protein with peptidoglycan-binding domain
MPFSLTWLPRVLENAGLKVATEFGWENRGRGEMGSVLGVMCHHTGDTRSGNMPSLGVLVNGRSDLPGPLAQLGLGRDGTYYVIAAGRCNHAGPGSWKGLTMGNSNFIGIEAENRGRASDAWPPVQRTAYIHGVAAILRHVRRGADFCVGHREWAPGRKKDPIFDMNAFRASVAHVLNGSTPPLGLIPREEPSGPAGRPGRPTLRRGMKGAHVLELQKKLGVRADGDFGPVTEAAVRAFQRQATLVPDGIVGPKTWAALDPVAEPTPPPVTPSAPLAWGARVSPEFKSKVRAISEKIGCDPNFLMACMAFETGETFSPSVRNRASGATGLIQFIPKTARGLGTSTDALAAMSAVEQLDFVEKYFQGRSVRTLEDVYMAILWPVAVGKDNDFVLFATPSRAYRQNSGLDRNRDGRITKAEAAAKVRAKLDRGLNPPFVG